ncbi:GNAT family N-acetyltransferase [Shewanella chilikensis]|uniref:GNAT family N-acetyltransferase n=1 Tax=Shewanella chilikensis TaxID=558541 RepID=UPI0030077CEA
MIDFVPAEIEDSKLILSFIHKLAKFENFPYEISVQESDLEKNLFSEDALARAIIIYYNESPVGFIVYYFSFSTTTGKKGLHLDDLYVEPEYQGLGLGKKALKYLAGVAIDNECARFEWWSLKTNEKAINFYKKLGAKELQEITVFRLTQEDCQNMILLSRLL